MHSTHSISFKLFVLLAVLSSKKPAGCNPITNSKLNDHIREFSLKDDNNTARIKTLQKEEPERYANFAPVHNPVRFKDTTDSVLSSSSYSRGLLHHEQPGYSIHDYDDEPPGYGYEYHIHDFDHGHHLSHHEPGYHGHYGGHHHGNHHHKHYDHALAAKTILWPIAGIALLGAAAALVSNPVLLQLGVVSGRRKRRDTEEALEPDINEKLSWLKKKDEKQVEDQTKAVIRWPQKPFDRIYITQSTPDNSKWKTRISKKMHSNVNQPALFKKVLPIAQSSIEDVTVHYTRRYNDGEENENRLIPVPLKMKKNN